MTRVDRKKTDRKPNPKSLANLKKGHGRPKGVPNKATREAKVVCNALVDDPVYLKNLRRRMRHGTAGTIETLIWHYAKGKPTERIELGADKSLAYLIAEAAGALPKDE
jgi:hypothetical protein